MKTYLNRQIVNRQFKGINPLDSGHEQCKPNHNFGPFARHYWLLHYVVSGHGEFTVHGNTYKLSKSDIFVIRPYEVTFYKADEKDPWHYIWIGFECREDLPSSFYQDVILGTDCGGVFASMLEAEHIDKGKESYLCARIWDLISKLSDDTSDDHSTNYIEQACTIIETEYMKKITVSDLAGMLNLDRSYFSTLFKEHKGKSPQEYICEFRLKKAAKLMVEHGYNASVAAVSTGYSDVFSFSRMFKRYFSVSPTEYVKLKKANQSEYNYK